MFVSIRTLQPYFEGLLPRDNPRNTRFAINFFTSIGLGGLTWGTLFWFDIYFPHLPSPCEQKNKTEEQISFFFCLLGMNYGNILKMHQSWLWHRSKMLSHQIPLHLQTQTLPQILILTAAVVAQSHPAAVTPHLAVTAAVTQVFKHQQYNYLLLFYLSL